MHKEKFNKLWDSGNELIVSFLGDSYMSYRSICKSDSLTWEKEVKNVKNLSVIISEAAEFWHAGDWPSWSSLIKDFQ